MSMNTVLLTGNMTGDPKMTKGTNGLIATFSVAVNRKLKDDKVSTFFVDIAAFGKDAEFCEKYFKKGASVSVIGALRTNTYEKDGDKKENWRVIAKGISFGDAFYQNEAFFSGRVARLDKRTVGDSTVVDISVAVNEGTKEKPITTFIKAPAFGKRAEFVDKYFKVGDGIYISGQLENNNFTTKDGKSVHEIRLFTNNISFAGKKSSEESKPAETANEMEDISDDIADVLASISDED